MKNLLVFLAAAFLGGAVAYGATQYHSIGNVRMSSSTVTGGLGLWQRTVAQLQSLTPTTTGQVVICIDCNVAYTICISSGSTAAYQWILSTGTACQ